LISDNIKGDSYAQVRYFWDDYFSEPGLFETIQFELAHSIAARHAWFDFTPEVFGKIPNKKAFEVQDGWVLYGDFIK